MKLGILERLLISTVLFLYGAGTPAAVPSSSTNYELDRSVVVGGGGLTGSASQSLDRVAGQSSPLGNSSIFVTNAIQADVLDA